VVVTARRQFFIRRHVFRDHWPPGQEDTKGLTAFTRMTVDLVKAMRVPAADSRGVEGIAPGPARSYHASDMRLAAVGAKVAFLFNRSARRLRYGCVRDPATHHRPVARSELLYRVAS